MQRSWNGRILVVVRLTDWTISQPLTAFHTAPLFYLSDGHAEQKATHCLPNHTVGRNM
jgi:hypothetical protein